MEAKKLILLRILEVLKEHSDIDHRLSQQDIIDLLMSQYSCSCERKAVSRNISYLKEAGYDIDNNREGYYLVDREFEPSELRLLIDSVLSNRCIDNKNSENLIKKLLALSNKYFSKSLKHIYYNKHFTKSDNSDVFYNIDILQEAIEKKKQVSFTYNTYNRQKELVPRKKEAYLINPYNLLIHNQRYYLLCNIDYYDTISYLRVDKITNINIIDNYSKPAKALKDYQNGLNLGKIDTALPYMFGGKITKISIKIKENIIGDIIDWFGTSFTTKNIDENFIEVNLLASVESMKYWILQYADNVEVLYPQSLRDEVKSTIDKMHAIYN